MALFGSSFLALLRLAGERRWKMAAAVALAVASAVLSLAPALAVYAALALILAPDFGPDAAGRLWTIGLWAVAAVAAQYVLYFASTMLSHMAAYDILYQLRRRILRHIARLPSGFFTARTSGATQKVLFDDVEEIEVFIAHHLPDLVSGLVLPGLVFCLLAWFDWRLALVGLLPAPVCLLLQARAFAVGRQDGLFARYHDAMETMNAAIIEYVRGMAVIKIFNRSVDSLARLTSSILAFRDLQCLWSRRAAPPWAMFMALTGAPLFVLLPAGLWWYFAGSLELPVLLLFLLLGPGALRPLAKVALLGGSLCRMGEGLARIQAVLAVPAMDQGQGGQAPRAGCDLEFDRVDFDHGPVPILRDISFTARAGTVTALVGPSGAGKSTMAGLAARLWDVRAGSVRIGGADVRELSQAALVQTVCAVFQDPFIFTESVHDNIAMGRPDAARRDVEAAARAARCHDFVAALPQGYDTVIGSGGSVHLSGGQRQRIALARALIKDAPVVILDEATAYADARNELEIQNALSVLLRGKTVLVAAHRLTTIAGADQILVVADGRIVERGRHDELLAAGGRYKALWEADRQASTWTIDGGEAVA
ncbi:MAG TPA: ABC transporter ATP-binding protein [Solidesulfovibrio magneticus]|nr:ABC transporter ATP-binding protein [Solidesulfovibrio magneticus]